MGSSNLTPTAKSAITRASGDPTNEVNSRVNNINTLNCKASYQPPLSQFVHL